MSLSILQRPCASTNFHAGRNNHPIVGIVIHIEEGSQSGTDAWFANPEAKVSAHYAVAKGGAIHQYVKEADTAYHAGIADRPSWWFAVKSPDLVNPSTIGIEHEGVAAVDLTDAQYTATAQLIADICHRHLIPIDDAHIVGHHAIRFSKPCPGIADVRKLITLAKVAGAGGGAPSSILT